MKSLVWSKLQQKEGKLHVAGTVGWHAAEAVLRYSVVYRSIWGFL